MSAAKQLRTHLKEPVGDKILSYRKRLEPTNIQRPTLVREQLAHVCKHLPFARILRVQLCVYLKQCIVFVGTSFPFTTTPFHRLKLSSRQFFFLLSCVADSTSPSVPPQYPQVLQFCPSPQLSPLTHFAVSLCYIPHSLCLQPKGSDRCSSFISRSLSTLTKAYLTLIHSGLRRQQITFVETNPKVLTLCGFYGGWHDMLIGLRLN